MKDARSRAVFRIYRLKKRRNQKKLNNQKGVPFISSRRHWMRRDSATRLTPQACGKTRWTTVIESVMIKAKCRPRGRRNHKIEEGQVVGRCQRMDRWCLRWWCRRHKQAAARLFRLGWARHHGPTRGEVRCCVQRTSHQPTTGCAWVAVQL